MARPEVRLTRLDSIDYCRRDNTGAGAFDDYDAEASSVAGVPKFLMEDTNDVMYFGWDAANYVLGWFAHTLGDYGNLTWEFWNGGAWLAFSLDFDSTSGFEANGYMTWSGLTGWAANTVDGQSAFWIRVTSAASVTTAAKFYSMMQSVTLAEPVYLEPRYRGEPYYRTVLGTVKRRDMSHTTVDELFIEATQRALPMENINLLHFWREHRAQVYVEDLAVTTPADPSIDAYFSDYTGRLRLVGANVASPSKMRARKYDIMVTVSSATGILQ